MLGFLFFLFFTKRLIKQSILRSSRLIRCVSSWNRAAGWRRREKERNQTSTYFKTAPQSFFFFFFLMPVSLLCKSYRLGCMFLWGFLQSTWKYLCLSERGKIEFNGIVTISRPHHVFRKIKVRKSNHFLKSSQVILCENLALLYQEDTALELVRLWGWYCAPASCSCVRKLKTSASADGKAASRVI